MPRLRSIFSTLALAVLTSLLCVFGISCFFAGVARGQEFLTAAGKPLEGELEPFLREEFFEKKMLFNGERTRGPWLVVGTDGTLVARGGGKLRLSEDGGETWGEPFDGRTPHIIDDSTGDIMQVSIRGREPRLWRSSDNGRTWEEEEVEFVPNELMRWFEETGFRKRVSWDAVNGETGESSYRLLICSFQTGITLHRGEYRGRLLLPAGMRPVDEAHSSDREPGCANVGFVLYSDDSGKTWKASGFFPDIYTSQEAAVAELSDGRVYYQARSNRGFHDRQYARDLEPVDYMRHYAWSYDGGESWEDHGVSGVLPDGGGYFRGYGMRPALVRLPVKGRDILIYGSNDTLGGERERITVWASFDGGETWPVKRLVFAGPSAYSVLAAGRPKTAGEGLIYYIFEGHETHRYNGIQIARFNLSWLLEGELTGDGEIPAWALD